TAAGKKGYDVLVMNSPLEQHFIGQLEQKTEQTSWTRVDADVMDKRIEKEEKIEVVLSEDQQSEVNALFEKAISQPGMSVSIEGLHPEELPVTITMDEFMRRMKDMAQNGGGGMMNFYGQLPDNYKVSVNGNHQLIQRLLAEQDEATRSQLAKQAVDLALLSQGLLNGSALTDFVNRSVDLIGK